MIDQPRQSVHAEEAAASIESAVHAVPESVGIREPPDFEADLAVHDRYQSFSGEVLRLALLGIGAIGFFLSKEGRFSLTGEARLSGVRESLWACLIAFGVACACALAHRYWSTEGVAALVDRDRKKHKNPADPRIEAADALMNSSFERSSFFIAASAFTLGGGAIALAVALGLCLTVPTK
ncbi:hypothetical protein [Myxococcus sp. CA040A]|uniref:hypothetical protein n=1 Tax=Myxococcus sp. CA040A TaxID=2741738 RepID=UPI00157B0337|nr:hypothetical protein [Myxococcus sp. CA040A]NTX09119.1 hypothetical protein [Myxococcus sp. CA040A]